MDCTAIPRYPFTFTLEKICECTADPDCSSKASIVVTVTGPAEAGVVRWFGLNWDLANGQSGTTRIVCPQFYYFAPGVAHTWSGRAGGAGYRFLFMSHWLDYITRTTRITIHYLSRLKILLTYFSRDALALTDWFDIRKRVTRVSFNPISTDTFTVKDDLGVMRPTLDMTMADSDFGSYTDPVRNVTYSWSRGTLWP